MVATRPVAWLLALLVWFWAAAAPAQTPSLPPADQFHLFLLIGQSNMAGRGTVAPEDKVPHPRVLMLNRDNAWVPAVDPIHFDKSVAGVGLGRSFGIQIAEARPGVTIGLIPCAVGGSPIDSWRPGVFYQPTKSHPWDDAIRRAKLALPSGTLKGILWHQGESDSTRELAPGYAAKLHDLVARLRAELHAPDVPFIAGQLGQFADAPWSEFKIVVDRAHRELPKHVKQTAFVSSDRLTHRGDKVHFNSDSYREIGRRYAEAYLGLLRK
ncbi:MAG: sialate O-acetylesterase [Opitutaceae bacterium]|nr:sialate O-acetylesterase [Opitutaceae bacterium]